jgi:hypothetical protein
MGKFDPVQFAVTLRDSTGQIITGTGSIHELTGTKTMQNTSYACSLLHTVATRASAPELTPRGEKVTAERRRKEAKFGEANARAYLCQLRTNEAALSVGSAYV